LSDQVRLASLISSVNKLEIMINMLLSVWALWRSGPLISQ